MSSLTPEQIRTLAVHLDVAIRESRSISKLTDEYPGLDFDDAYAIQDALRGLCLGRGERIVGYKTGLTSRAKMKQMGVDTPVFGFLSSAGALPDGGEVDCTQLIHPRVEPEIAFVTKRALRGPGCHIGAVLAATDFVLPAIEVIDSRYRDFKFDLQSVVADNTSAARYVVGGCMGQGLDLRTLGVVLEKNGEPVAFGAGAAVVGHPAAAIAMLVNHLGARGEELPAGSLILSGGITEAVAVAAGDNVSLRVQGLGSVSLRFR